MCKNSQNVFTIYETLVLNFTNTDFVEMLHKIDIDTD